MYMFEYKWGSPSISVYKQLLVSVGWTSIIEINDESLQSAIDNSWQWISAFNKDELVGIGRIISDGALYALICDMIVLPEYQNQGIGTGIIKMLRNKCSEHDIQRVWLFAAPGRSDFYQKKGFEIRSDDAPGMQMTVC